MAKKAKQLMSDWTKNFLKGRNMKDQIIENKIAANNILADFINDRIPKINKYLEKNEIKLKSNGVDLFKKNHGAIRAILKTDNPKIRAYSSATQYTLSIRCDINYKTSDFSCDYIHRDFGVYGFSSEKIFEFNPLEKMDYKKYMDTKKRLSEIRDIEDNLRTEKSNLKFSIME